MGAVERLGGKKSDVVRVKIFIAVSVFLLWHLPASQGHLTQCSPLGITREKRQYRDWKCLPRILQS